MEDTDESTESAYRQCIRRRDDKRWDGRRIYHCQSHDVEANRGAVRLVRDDAGSENEHVSQVIELAAGEHYRRYA
jgi:hypothetical protein